MKSSFSISKYHYKKNLAYNFDPRLKFFLFLFLGISIFFLQNITTLLIMFLFISIGIMVARINPLIYWKTFKPIIFVFAFTLFFYYFFGNFEEQIAIGGNTKIYYATYYSTIISFKVYDVLLVGTLLILTTSELELSSTIAWYIHPLYYLKVPVNEISMVITLGLRFVPVVLADLKTILYAQETRGVSYREGNIKERVQAFNNALLPLFIVSFRRADDISKAMIARGYIIGAKRSSYSKKRLTLSSLFLFLLAAAIISWIFYLQFHCPIILWTTYLEWGAVGI